MSDMTVIDWHRNIWDKWVYLQSQVQFPHAVLISGQTGLGQQKLLYKLAKQLNCTEQQSTPCGHCDGCRMIDVGTHPDVFVLKAEEKKAILVEQVRDFCAQIALTQSSGLTKVAIIFEAHKMTHNAANSLLKTLEEPPKNTVIVLESTQPKRLPITVRSRCQQFVLKTPPLDITRDYLMAHSPVSVIQAEQALRMHFNAPESAFLSLNNGVIKQQLQFVQGLTARALKQEQSLTLEKTLGDLGLPVLIGWALSWLSDVKKVKQGVAKDMLTYPEFHQDLLSWTQGVSSKQLNSLQDDWTELSRTANHPVNLNLTLERLYIQLLTLS